MFTKRSWESFYSGLVMVGLVFMVFPVIYFCGATKEKQILPPLIMFLLGLVIFVISVHFSVKYHKEKTKYTKYKIDKSLTYTFTLTYGDKVETVTDFPRSNMPSSGWQNTGRAMWRSQSRLLWEA